MTRGVRPYRLKNPKERNCKTCGKHFIPRAFNHWYCRPYCRPSAVPDPNREMKPCGCIARARCLRCGKDFPQRDPENRYCSVYCAVVHKSEMQEKDKGPVEPPTNANPTSTVRYNELWCDNEREFVEWFKENYIDFGIIELIRVDNWFPDVMARMITGEVLRIELEYHASNFGNQHRGGYCDLVIAFLKNRRTVAVAGVPVVAVFNVNANRPGLDPKTKELTEFFREVITATAAKIMRLVKNPYKPSGAD